MRGDPEIIELLNEVLTAELTGDQPVLRARQDVRQLGLLDSSREHIRDESIDEMKHAERARSSGSCTSTACPNLQRLGTAARSARRSRSSSQSDLAARVRRRPAAATCGVALCVAKGDNGTRELLARHPRRRRRSTSTGWRPSRRRSARSASRTTWPSSWANGQPAPPRPLDDGSHGRCPPVGGGDERAGRTRSNGPGRPARAPRRRRAVATAERLVVIVRRARRAVSQPARADPAFSAAARCRRAPHAGSSLVEDDVIGAACRAASARGVYRRTRRSGDVAATRRRPRTSGRTRRRSRRRAAPAVALAGRVPTCGSSSTEQLERVAGADLAAEAGAVEAAEQRQLAGEALVGEHGHGADLGDRLAHQHARQRRPAREVAGEEPLVAGEVPATGRRPARLERRRARRRTGTAAGAAGRRPGPAARSCREALRAASSACPSG